MYSMLKFHITDLYIDWAMIVINFVLGFPINFPLSNPLIIACGKFCGTGNGLGRAGSCPLLVIIGITFLIAWGWTSFFVVSSFLNFLHLGSCELREQIRKQRAKSINNRVWYPSQENKTIKQANAGNKPVSNHLLHYYHLRFQPHNPTRRRILQSFLVSTSLTKSWNPISEERSLHLYCTVSINWRGRRLNASFIMLAWSLVC